MMNVHLSSILLYLALLSYINGEVLKISQGLINGTRFTSKGGKTFSAFIGIPYAQPPIGSLRFKNPVPANTWNGVRPADKEAKKCPQLSENDTIIGEEDCLYLNVYSPRVNFHSPQMNSTSDRASLMPVMVWIHGGGFFSGSGGPSQFSPNYLIDKEDIIFVSMNYRLGIFGFFSTGDSVAPGNFGLKDQVLALKWVQKNIEFFGGNPNRITLFGASAGGTCVNLHALSDASNGLFHQYIIQSGSVLAPWAYGDRSKFKPYVKKLAEYVGCPIDTSNDLVNCLRETSVQKLLNVLKFDFYNFPELYWIPTNEPESEEAFLTDSPKNLLEQNKMKDYPVISGNVVDEGILVTLPFYANMTSESVNHHVVDNYINLITRYYVTPNDIPKFREKIKDYYFGSIISSQEDKLLKNLTQFLSDSGFLYPQKLVADKMTKMFKNDVYFYLFGYSGKTNLLVFERNIQGTYGVAHGDDILYLYPILPSNFMSENDLFMKNLMTELWTSFAINGKPTSNLLNDTHMWLPHNQNNNFLRIGTILNNTDSLVTLQHDYFSDRMDFWKRNFPLSAYSTFISTYND